MTLPWAGNTQPKQKQNQNCGSRNINKAKGNSSHISVAVMITLNLNRTRLCLPLYNSLRKKSTESTSGNDISWSTGEKEWPISWRHYPEHWYKRKSREIKPHFLDAKDPKQKYPYKRKDGGIQYFNFVYYPRYPDVEDPPISPTKLLMVIRTQNVNLRPYWEKDIMTKIGLFDARNKNPVHKRRNTGVAICKNIPEMNAMLWQVKHLVQIMPLNLPENLPKDANPLHCFIKEDGELVYNPSSNVCVKDLETDFEEKEKFGREWVDKHTRKVYQMSLNPEF